MSLSVDEINKIADLAKLSIEENQIQSISNDLTQILDLVAKMDEAKTQQIEPLAHPLDEKQRLRDDLVTEPNQRELFQQLAPKTGAGLYIVPKVIDNE